MRQQRTLRQVIGCAGVGLHSGAMVAMTLRPAAEGTGIRFRRVDRPGAGPVAAHPLNASVVDGSICLGDPGGTSVLGVDRLLAALAAAEIDNILIELSGPELPAMDGTPRPLLLLLECAGTVEQARPPRMLEVLRPLEVASALGRIRLEPADGLQLAIEGPAAATDAIVTPRSKREARGAALDALGGLASRGPTGRPRTWWTARG